MTGHEIIADGRTVWVNDARGCIARFGRGGIDVHRCDGSANECLFCTHETPTAADWVTFCEQVKLRHGVVVGDEHRPALLLDR